MKTERERSGDDLYGCKEVEHQKIGALGAAGINGHVTFATCLLDTQNENNAPDRPSLLVPYDSTQLKPLP